MTPTWRHPLPATPVLESLGVTSHDFQNIFIVITLVLFISFTKDKLVNTDFEVLSIIGRSNSHHTMTDLIKGQNRIMKHRIILPAMVTCRSIHHQLRLLLQCQYSSEVFLLLCSFKFYGVTRKNEKEIKHNFIFHRTYMDMIQR